MTIRGCSPSWQGILTFSTRRIPEPVGTREVNCNRTVRRWDGAAIRPWRMSGCTRWAPSRTGSTSVLPCRRGSRPRGSGCGLAGSPRFARTTLLGATPEDITAGKMAYDLRRLREHGLIARIPHTRRYQVTDTGLHQALPFNHAHDYLLRAGLAQTADPARPRPPGCARRPRLPSRLRRPRPPGPPRRLTPPAATPAPGRPASQLT